MEDLNDIYILCLGRVMFKNATSDGLRDSGEWVSIHRYKVAADNVCPGEALLHTRNTLGKSRRAFSSDE
jgi:hypothetical protein